MSQHPTTRRIAAACAFILCASAHAAPPDARPWNLAVRASVSHDSNVPLAATDSTFAGEKSSTVFGLGATGDYLLYKGARWSVKATGALQQTRNADSSLREFDLTSLSPGIQAQRSFRLAGRPARLSLGYAARRDWLGGSGYATGQGATIDIGVRPKFATELGVFASASGTNFDDEGPDPALSSRDAVAYSAGVRAMHGFNSNRQAVRATLAYVKNDAKGANFVFDGPSAGVQFLSYLYGPWAMAASASLARADYTNFAVDPRRETRIRDYRLVFFGPLSRKLSADLSLGRTEHRANQAIFEADRKYFSLGVTYSF